jgi:hypothetical protein
MKQPATETKQPLPSYLWGGIKDLSIAGGPTSQDPVTAEIIADIAIFIFDFFSLENTFPVQYVPKLR